MYVRVHTFTYVCLTTYLPHNYFHCALSIGMIQFEYCQEMCAVALLIYSTGCRNTEGGLFQHHGHSSHQAVLASLCRQCSNIYTYFCLNFFPQTRQCFCSCSWWKSLHFSPMYYAMSGYAVITMPERRRIPRPRKKCSNLFYRSPGSDMIPVDD